MRVIIENGPARVEVETDMMIHDTQVLEDMATQAVRMYAEAFPDEDAEL
jgi:hypothetical protein